jgi:predicted component of type VI protein secretion system
MPRLRVKDGERDETVALTQPMLTIGRSPDNHVILTDRECSRHHCYIERVETGYKLVDMESRNGTKANGQFRNQHVLQPGDVVTIGKAEMTFEGDEGAEPAGAAAAAPPEPAPSHSRARPGRANEDAGATRVGSRSHSAPDLAARRQELQVRQRIAERKRERRLMTWVFALAGICLLALAIALAVVLVGSDAGEEKHNRRLFREAEESEGLIGSTTDPAKKVKHLQIAIEKYELVSPKIKEMHAKAQQEIVRLKEAIKTTQQEAVKQMILKEFTDVEAQCLKSRPADIFGAVTRYEKLLEKTPADHPLRSEIQQKIEQARALREGTGPSKSSP